MCIARRKKSFVQATNSQIKELKINMEELGKLQKEVTINDNMAIMELMQDEIEEEGRKTIIFRTYSNRAHKIDRMLEKILEPALKSIWRNWNSSKEVIPTDPSK